MASLILTLVGPDRPGLVSAISQQVAASGGSWLESRMAHLAGQFAGIVLVTLPDEAVATLSTALTAAQSDGMRIELHPTESAPPAAMAPTLTLELVCQDRPGIIRDVTGVLSASGVNIVELTTNILSGSFSGEAMFRAEALLRLPPEMDAAVLRGELERLGNDMMVDISLGDATGKE